MQNCVSLLGMLSDKHSSRNVIDLGSSEGREAQVHLKNVFLPFADTLYKACAWLLCRQNSPLCLAPRYFSSGALVDHDSVGAITSARARETRPAAAPDWLSLPRHGASTEGQQFFLVHRPLRG